LAKEIKVRIRGTSDYIQHGRPPESEGEENNRISGEKDYSKDWQKAVYRDEKIGCYIPAKHFQATLKKSGVDFKIKGKGRKTYKDRMDAAVVVTPEKIPFTPKKKEPDYVHEDWGKIPPRTGSMVWITRPAFKEGWEAEFSLLILDDQISKNIIKEILANAGQFYGIGDWRPHFGRFEVVKLGKDGK